MRAIFILPCCAFLGVFVTDCRSETCDFDLSGICDIADIDALTTDVALGDNDLLFDLNEDAQVDEQDVDKWLLDAAILNGFGGAYLAGDANLDGSVNAADLMTVGLHWQSSVQGWSNGDFHSDGIVNARDLNEVAKNWQKTAPQQATSVPEPLSYLLLLFGGLGFAHIVRHVPWIPGRLCADGYDTNC